MKTKESQIKAAKKYKARMKTISFVCTPEEYAALVKAKGSGSWLDLVRRVCADRK